MSQPTVFNLADVTSDEELIQAWRTLAWETPGTSYFQSPEWVISWWDHLAGRPETRVAVWRSPTGEVEAVAAMSRRAERLHRRVAVPVSFWTNAGSGPGAADHTGFPTVDGRRRAVAEWVDGLDGSVLLRNVAPEFADLVPPGARPIEDSACPRLTIPPGDGPIGRSTSFRKRLRRNGRLLREQGIEFRGVSGPEITDALLQRLMELHEARSDAQGWATTFTPERIGFHRQLVATAGQGRGPGMMVAERAGEVVGILYGFWWRGSFSYFQTGWDPSWWELSLGTALVYEAILHARQAGAALFDFLRGPEDYKYRFGAEDHVDRTWLLARGASGRILEAKARVG